MGTAATKATGRDQKKKGFISKSYKLDGETVEMFAEACETSQAKELTKFMKRYIRKHHPDFE